MMEFKITDKILCNISDIAYMSGEMDAYKGFENRLQLIKKNRIASVGAALCLSKGASAKGDIDLEAVGKVINGTLTSLSPLRIREIKDIYAVSEILHMVNPYDIADLKKVHMLMSYKLSPMAGNFSRSETEIKEVFASLETSSPSLHPVLQAAALSFYISTLRPFDYGNEAIACFWQKSILIRWHDFFRYVPIEKYLLDHLMSYLSVLDICIDSCDMTEFIEFMTEILREALDATLVDIKTSSSEISRYVRKLLEVMELGVPYTSREILDRIGLKSKETFRAHYIDPALELGLVIMTEPDKPTSRNQRYIRK